MGIAKAAATTANGETPPAKRFWRSTKDKHISRSIRFFLWMLLHGAYKVGQFWDNIPSCVQRGKCTRCGVHESMEHILTQCSEPGQKEIWDLASEMWRLKTGKELRPTIGQIMAGGVNEMWGPRNNTPTQDIDHRVGAPHLAYKKRASNPGKRLAIDCVMTDKFKYERKALKASLVKDTWKSTLKDEHSLARDWPKRVGVLVGVG
ncbi:hypothetical protein C8R47DRAFT_480492 [Mycena vitilis]|nr:hypothetical protein C8R47DRAFT_480492 [Mycena vitilis]